MNIEKEILEKIRSNDRTVQTATLRHAVCLVLAKKGLSEPKIGQIINRNHSTVHYSKVKATQLLEVNDPIMVGVFNRVNG